MIEKEKIIKRAINTYGKKMQITVAMEELSELIKELSKHLRGEHNKEHIIEEIADVEIMISQLKIILNIKDIEIDNEILFKLNRLRCRLEGKENDDGD